MLFRGGSEAGSEIEIRRQAPRELAVVVDGRLVERRLAGPRVPIDKGRPAVFRLDGSEFREQFQVPRAALAGLRNFSALDGDPPWVHASGRRRFWSTPPSGRGRWWCCGRPGVEAEADLAFAGLYSLVRPVLSGLDALPERQRAALSGGLGLEASGEADRLLISAAVLGLLSAVAGEQPLLCLIDDVQWLDRPSVDALVFAARRLRGERLALLFSAREGEPAGLEDAGLPELRLEGLDSVSAAAMLADPSCGLASAVRERLLAEARGRPLALLELPGALSDQQLSGTVALPEAIPLTPRLQRVFQQRIERLPEPTQTVLLIAAAEDTRDLATVLRAAQRVELRSDALDAAERAGLIGIVGGRIAFRHPLVRSAVWDSATTRQRQHLHATLALVLTAEEHTDRRVWHQAMATLTADEEVACRRA